LAGGVAANAIAAQSPGRSNFGTITTILRSRGYSG
jgi:hypothetical protein